MAVHQLFNMCNVSSHAARWCWVSFLSIDSTLLRRWPANTQSLIDINESHTKVIITLACPNAVAYCDLASYRLAKRPQELQQSSLQTLAPYQLFRVIVSDDDDVGRKCLLYEGPVFVRYVGRQASWSSCAILPRAG